MNLAVDSSAKATLKEVYATEEGMTIEKMAKELDVDASQLEKIEKKIEEKTGKKADNHFDEKDIKTAFFSGKISTEELEKMGIDAEKAKEIKEDAFNSVIQTATEDKPAMEREELDEIVEEKLGMTRAKECKPTEKKCGTEKEDPVECKG